MGKYANDSAMDAMLSWIADADTVTVCSTQPTDYTQATSTYKLADVTVSSGDFSLATGDASGRKVTIAQQANVPIDTGGTAQHVAICKSTGSVLKYVTTCSSQGLTSGGTVTIPAWDIEVADPT